MTQALPEIVTAEELQQLVDAEKEIPCEYIAHGSTTPCPRPAEWMMKLVCTCGNWGQQVICDFHKEHVMEMWAQGGKLKGCALPTPCGGILTVQRAERL